MSLNPSEPDDLLAAWALGALDPVERAAIDRLVASDPSVAERAHELQRTVAALDTDLLTPPPTGLAERILAEANARPPVLAQPSLPLDLLTHQTDALGELLDHLEPADWDRPTHPYDWNVRGLVAHLLVIEQYTAGILGLEADGPVGDGHLTMGADQIAGWVDSPTASLADAWRDRADRTIEALRSGQGPAPDTEVGFHEWSFSVDGLSIVRAFEMWTHADDIRRATGRPLWTPLPSDLRAMSAFSVSTLPSLMADVAPDTLHNARVVLTGEGGGTFNLGDRAANSPSRQLTLVTDVVDYCHRVAGRVDREDLDFTAEGDLDLAHQLLDVASAFAV